MSVFQYFNTYDFSIVAMGFFLGTTWATKGILNGFVFILIGLSVSAAISMFLVYMQRTEQ